MLDKWNERFSVHEYVYGKEPNKFFKEQIDLLPPGKILLPGEGEGRNAVYAARAGWTVDAVDYSIQARKKAENLARENNILINYTIADLELYTPKENHYDAVSLTFVHFPPDSREKLHRKLVKALKSGGAMILQVYDKEQLKFNSGGPKEEGLLYSLENIFSDFHELEIRLFSAEKAILEEGILHKGIASVINYVGIKN